MKTFKGIIAQKNHSQTAIVITDHNQPIQIVFAEDHQIDDILKTILKTDIADKIVKTISLTTITLNQSQIEIITET